MLDDIEIEKHKSPIFIEDHVSNKFSSDEKN